MSANYYILKPAVGTKETGNVFPAVESYDNYDFDAPNSVYKLDSDMFPDFVPDIRFKLAIGAKLCDLMGQATISACGLLMSEKFKNVIEQNNILPHQFYSATIEDNGILHQYYWMHVAWKDGIKYLDFQNSKFRIKRASKDLGEIKIVSYEDLLNKQGELGFIKMIHNYESTMFNPKIELFIHPLNKTFYITETLKSIIKSHNLSGSDFQPADNLKVI